MLGAQIGETKGRRVVRRVISTDPTTVEVSFEDSGHLFGCKPLPRKKLQYQGLKSLPENSKSTANQKQARRAGSQT
jgi:hypothetical protein